MYEHTSDKQQRDVSNFLSSHSQSSYHAEMAKLDYSDKNIQARPYLDPDLYQT